VYENVLLKAAQAAVSSPAWQEIRVRPVETTILLQLKLQHNATLVAI
jgi:hypothetical protein